MQLILIDPRDPTYSPDALRTQCESGKENVALIWPLTCTLQTVVDLEQGNAAYPINVLDFSRGPHARRYANIKEALAGVVTLIKVYVDKQLWNEALEYLATGEPPLVKKVVFLHQENFEPNFLSHTLPTVAKYMRLTLSFSFLSVEVSRMHEEHQYLDLVRRIMVFGDCRADRTGTGTFSIWGAHLRFSLFGNTLPLITTKKTFWKGVKEELLWFIEGCTDAQVLSDRGVRIWDANGSREFLDRRGLVDNDEGALGVVYGAQWRHFNAPYVGKRNESDGQLPKQTGGIDQLQQCIDLLRTTPNTRRCILSAWNPQQLDQMALPPCHVMCQFSVRREKYLVAHLYQRSADVGLGLPFNIASYSLLCHLVAHVTGYEATELIVTLGDAHLYTDHIAPLCNAHLLDREPMAFPTVTIEGKFDSIDDIKSSHILLHNYKSYPAVKLPFST